MNLLGILRTPESNLIIVTWPTHLIAPRMEPPTPPFLQSHRTSSGEGHIAQQCFHVLYTLLVLAIVANGLHFWLQKSQVIPSTAYIEYRQKLEEAYETQWESADVPDAQEILDELHVVRGTWILTKLLKDLFCLATILVSLFLLWRSEPRFTLPPVSPQVLILMLLGLSVCLAAVISISRFGPGVAVMGLRPIAYVVAGLLAAWVGGQKSLGMLAYYLVAVLMIELLLGLYEHAYGLPLFYSERVGNRINGTFSYPSSLGIFAVCTYALASSFSRIPKLFLLVPVAALVYLSGSATATVLLAVWLGVWAILAAPLRWRPVIRITSLAVLAGTLLAMPKLVARYDVMDALWGRVEVATDYANHLPEPLAILFGKGLGIGSNVFNSALVQSDAISDPEGVDMYHARADSTPMALVNQLGVVGTLLFYFLLGAASWRDRPAGPIFLILFLASLTVNLLELFPINFLLGLLLGRSLLFPRQGISRTIGGKDGPANF